MQGGHSRTPLFWEVWFGMHEMQRRRYGDPPTIESSIRMAEDLGMAALAVGGVNINAGFGAQGKAQDGTTHYCGGSLTSLDQLAERPLPDWSQDIPAIQSNLRAVRDAGIAGVLYMPWCFHTIATGMGLQSLALRVCEDPEFVHACMRWVEERNRAAIRQVVAAVMPDLVLFDGDCSYKTGLMVNPVQFRALVYEETRQTTALLRELGVPYMLHTDGKLDDVIPVLTELGFAAIHGCEKQANDLDHLVDAFGDDICLIGNMDVVFLATTTVDEVRRETDDMLRRGMRKNRFIAACNTSPLDYIPEENYLAMCDVIKRFGRA